MKKRLFLPIFILILTFAFALPALAAGSDSWQAYLDYAADVIRADEEEGFVDMALNTLLTESNEADPDGWPFEMFVGRGLFVSYDEFLATIYTPDASDDPSGEASNEPSGEASGEPSTEPSGEASDEPSGEASDAPIEVTNDRFGSYVSYLRKYMEEYNDPKLDEGGKQMALSELDSVDVGSDVYGFPFEMFVSQFDAMTFDEFIRSKNDAASSEPQTQEEFDAYVQYVRDYMDSYTGEGAKEGFDEAGKTMALAELDNVRFGASSVNSFPFEMFVNEFGVASYDDFLAAK